MITEDRLYQQQFSGLSSDAKPAEVGNGSEFLEMDTGKTYRFNAAGNAWLEQPSGGSGGGSSGGGYFSKLITITVNCVESAAKSQTKASNPTSSVQVRAMAYNPADGDGNGVTGFFVNDECNAVNLYDPSFEEEVVAGSSLVIHALLFSDASAFWVASTSGAEPKSVSGAAEVVSMEAEGETYYFAKVTGDCTITFDAEGSK